MKLVLAVFVVLVATAAAQYGNYFALSRFPGAGSGFDSFPGAGGLNQVVGAARDPRANTGPVVFPPSPPGDPSMTSGVVAGASGYGFVPPNPQGVNQIYYSRYFF